MDSNRGIRMQIMDRKREQEDIESEQNLWLEDISNVDDFGSRLDYTKLEKKSQKVLVDSKKKVVFILFYHFLQMINERYEKLD